MLDRNLVIQEIIDYVTLIAEYPITIDESSNLQDDAGLDSLDAVDLSNHLKMKFGTRVDGSDLGIKNRTVGQITDFYVAYCFNENLKTTS